MDRYWARRQTVAQGLVVAISDTPELEKARAGFPASGSAFPAAAARQTPSTRRAGAHDAVRLPAVAA